MMCRSSSRGEALSSKRPITLFPKAPRKTVAVLKRSGRGKSTKCVFQKLPVESCATDLTPKGGDHRSLIIHQASSPVSRIAPEAPCMISHRRCALDLRHLERNLLSHATRHAMLSMTFTTGMLSTVDLEEGSRLLVANAMLSVFFS